MKFLAWLFIAIGLSVSAVWPTVYWFQNDALSSMQIFKLFWPHILIGNFMYLAGYIYLERRR